MKKILLLMLVSLCLFTVGCGSQTGSTGQDSQEKAVSQTTPTENSELLSAPDRTPDMVGKVKSIEGNKVTVYKAGMGKNNTPPKEKAKTKQKDSLTLVTEETYDLFIPESTPIVIGQGEGKNSDNKVITLLGIADIKEDSLLRVWFGEELADGQQSVEFVQVLQTKKE